MKESKLHGNRRFGNGGLDVWLDKQTYGSQTLDASLSCSFWLSRY